MGALAGLMGGGGMSVSDSTSVNFNPFADNSKKGSVTNIIKSPGANGGLDTGSLLPIAIVAGLILIVWKFLK